VVLIVLPAISNFDRTQLLAARSLGAGAFRSVMEIMLPQILPSLVAAFCLTSAVAVGAYGTALALVGTQVNILPPGALQQNLRNRDRPAGRIGCVTGADRNLRADCLGR
jgi:ABC-type spermidine/putrescine transport system permease subunit II